MKRIFAFTSMLSLLSLGTLAQKTIKGIVTDAASGKPLPGATVSFGSSATSTDKEGTFYLECGKTTAVVVSYVGYETQKKNIKNCDAILNIAMVSIVQSIVDIEITASSSQNKSFLYQPASITKLGRLELNRGNGLFLDDAIQTNVPGVTMNRRSVSGGQQLNIRGYGNGARGTKGVSSNFDGQGYKVYLNGIPVTDAEGITTMDDLDFGSVGNVELAKGPAGTLYGLAIAGAVNLKLVEPEKGKTSIGQDLLVGNYGLQRLTTRFQTAGEHSSLLLNYGNQKSDGFSIHNASKKDFVNLIGNFQPNSKEVINTYAGYSNSYDQRLGELTIAQYEGNDYSGNPEYIKRNAHSNVVTFRTGLGHTYYFNKNVSNSTSVFGTGFTSNVSSAGGWTDKNAINIGLRSTMDTKFSLNGSTTLSGITGVETQRQDAQVIGYSMKADPSDPNPSVYTYGLSPYWVINAATANVATVSKTTSLFTEWTLALPKDLSLTAGIGVSNMKITLNDRFNTALATRPASFYKAYTGMLAPHLALNKVFNKHFSIYAAYSKGYKAPVSSFFYITTPAVTTPATPATGRVNEVLKPEIGNQFEIGTKGQLMHNRLTYELTCFNAVFSNKMTAISVVSPASPTSTLYSYVVNGRKQLHNGVEALVKYTVYQSEKGFFSSIRPFANITYSDFNYGDHFTIQKSVTVTEDYSKKAVAGVAKIMANLGLDINTAPGMYLNISYNYKDKMPITSLNDTYAASYNLLNGKIGLKRSVGKHIAFDAFLGVNNATGTKYYLMAFVNQLPDAYIPAPTSATVFGGVNLQYNF